ncbi:hypothetical protein [uncultured Mucilaginibacter sp.]|uniref:hypothetical protein n=1 Tax=uncultured Mucilaginibacter sp. TaxID=797541 RepID=UPI0025E39FFB|nr:hypothetical protein [uncultured Mucilaginibacter sp.]
MKPKLTLLFFIIACRVFAQHHLPVVKANSNKAKFYEENMAVYNWYINPAEKPDVFTTGKLTRATSFVFKTDTDSISFKLKPGQQKDFIVLLNGKDSCFTRIQSSEPKNYSASANAFHDTVAFKINKFNTNYLPVVINGTDSILLNFDTGATDVCIISDSLKKKVKAKLKLYSTPYAISIGNKEFKSKIYDITTAGHEVDGLLGWDLFDGMVVELDYDKQKMIIHSAMPKHLTKDKGYEKLNITYIRNKPFIESEISQDGVISKSLFFFDLGYQRAAMFDNDVLVNAKFPVNKMHVIKKVIMHGSRGNEIPVITAALQDLQIGKFRLKNVPAQIMTEGKPLPGTNVHYLGSDVLKRFNTVLDFQHNVIYLKPNRYYNTAFAN